MSTFKVVRRLISSLKSYDFICVNFACPDMVGHTGDLAAGIKAAEAVDKAVKKVVQATLKSGAALIITSDHGNLELMLNVKTKEIITEHTTNLVPFILVAKGPFASKVKLKTGGNLSNVAPTILKLFNLTRGKLMSKKSLI